MTVMSALSGVLRQVVRNRLVDFLLVAHRALDFLYLAMAVNKFPAISTRIGEDHA